MTLKQLTKSSETKNQAIICDTPESINAFHLLALKGALKLETLGMRHSRGSAAKVVRDTLKDKGKKTPANKILLLAEFEAYLREVGILKTPHNQNPA